MSVEELDKNIEQVGQRKPIEFEHADFFMRCTCGHIHTIDTNVKGLLRFDMHTTDMHNMLLKCPKCEHELEIYFKDAANPPSIEVKEKVEDESGVKQPQEVNAEADETDDRSQQGSGKEKKEEEIGYAENLADVLEEGDTFTTDKGEEFKVTEVEPMENLVVAAQTKTLDEPVQKKGKDQE